MNLTKAQMAQIVEDVRNQENLLDAISAAQPIINEVAKEMGDLADEAKIYLDEGQAEVARQWKS